MTENPDQTANKALDTAFNEWRKRLPKRLELHCEKEKVRSIQPVCMSFGRTILAWCKANNEKPEDFYSKIGSIEEFSTTLYQALSHQDGEKQSRWSLWHHANIDNLVELKTKKYRDGYADWQSVKQSADEYLKRPWLHNENMDWVYLDALICSAVLGGYEFIQSHRLGFAYAIFDGNFWKAKLFRIVWVPFVFFLGWILPGLICWGLYNWVPKIALVLATLYYGYSIYLVFRQIVFHVGYRIRNRKSLQGELNERFMAIVAAYNRLNDETIHVPSLRREIEDAQKKGVVWSSQVLCLLDNIEEKNKITWSRSGPPVLFSNVDIFEDDEVEGAA